MTVFVLKIFTPHTIIFLKTVSCSTSVSMIIEGGDESAPGIGLNSGLKEIV
jgi:hypothetical protein